ncbi:MAG: DNA repair protein RecN [Bacteroidota bacterium]
MLKRLSISNYALIDKTEILPGHGLSIITGETGSGKSIMLDALGLVAGQRADVSALQDKSKKCVIEAEFETVENWFKDFFSENDLDYSEVSIFRREINPNGNSRAFVNDTPVNLSILKILASQLIDIHSQHQTLEINQSLFQTNVLDSFCGNQKLRDEYSLEFNAYKQKIKSLEELKQKAQLFNQEKDYLNFLFSELEELKIKENEEDELETEINQLSHAEEIQNSLQKILYLIGEEENNVLIKLSESKNLISTTVKFKQEFSELKSRIDSVYIELKDIQATLEKESENFIYDPIKLDELNLRMSLIQKLKKKHAAVNANQLIEIYNEIELKLSESSGLDIEIDNLSKETKKLEENLNKLALELSKKRKSNTNLLSKNIVELLVDLGMPSSELIIELSSLPELNSTGLDTIKFLFSANKGIQAQNISSIASGGELSRLMLAIKYISSLHQDLPTIIFDEIDTGVSGEVAYKVGLMLQKMSKTTQLIAITHLPQIAGKAENHYFVYKESDNQKTNSKIKELSKEDRVLEIAKMLSNGNPGEAAILNAKELMA